MSKKPGGLLPRSLGPLGTSYWLSGSHTISQDRPKSIRKEISTDLKFKRDKLINKLQLVSREEFEVLKKLVLKQELALKKISKKNKSKKVKKS